MNALRWAIVVNGLGLMLGALIWLVVSYAAPRVITSVREAESVSQRVPGEERAAAEPVSAGASAGMSREDLRTIGSMIALVVLFSSALHVIAATLAWNEREPKVVVTMLAVGALSLVPTSLALAVLGIRNKRVPVSA